MTGWEELWKKHRTDMIQRNIYYRLAILGYQYGDVQKAIVYRNYYGSEGIHSELKIALADLIAQTHILCSALELDYDELSNLGEKRLAEFILKRMKTCV